MTEVLFSLEEMAKELSLSLIGQNRSVNRIVLDSRFLSGNALFVCLKGEVTDGHNYIASAAASCSCSSLVSAVWYEAHKEEADTLCSIYDHSLLVCSDPLMTLQDMSALYLNKFNPVKIALTGSNGKTTTKDILASVMRMHAETHCNPGNYNSETGLPLSLFMLGKDHKYLIAEMGMNHAGEITRLADLVRPDYALITNVGAAHIGLMGSEEAIAHEKKEIFNFFDGSQTAFIPSDDKWSAYLSENVKGKVITYNWEADENISYSLDENQSLIVNYKGKDVHTPLSGAVNFKNVCAAVSVAEELGVSTAHICAGLENISSSENRNQFFYGRLSVLSDCYNANTESLESGLQIVAGIKKAARRIIVLADMKELGEFSKNVHEEAGRLVSELNPEAVFLLGNEVSITENTLSGLKYKGYIKKSENFDDLSASLLNYVSPEDLVYLKGAHSMALERFIPLFREQGWIE